MRWNANSVRVGKRPSSLDCGCSLPLSLPKLAEEPAPFAEELPALAEARPSLDCGCLLPLSLPKLAEEFPAHPALAKARPPKR